MPFPPAFVTGLALPAALLLAWVGSSEGVPHNSPVATPHAGASAGVDVRAGTGVGTGAAENAGPRQAQPPTGESVVATELLADTAKIEAGKPFRLLMVFRCQSGWHLYWKNPGDSGAPPTIQFKLPAGFTAGALEYPCPTVHDDHGETTYVHEGEFALVATITPPTDPAAIPADARFTAAMSWLVCKQLCVMGSREHTLTLTAKSASTIDVRVQRFVSSLPRTPESLGVTAAIDGTTLVITSSTTPRGFIPATTPGVAYGAPATKTIDGRATLRVPLTLSPQNALGQPLVAAGALVVDDKASPPVFTEISVPVPTGGDKH